MKAITRFEDNAGQVHETREAATIGDLAHIIGEGRALSDDIANIPRIIFKNREAIRAALDEYEMVQASSPLTVVEAISTSITSQAPEIKILQRAGAL